MVAVPVPLEIVAVEPVPLKLNRMYSPVELLKNTPLLALSTTQPNGGEVHAEPLYVNWVGPPLCGTTVKRNVDGKVAGVRVVPGAVLLPGIE